jgi:hypothetical protein
MMLRTLGLFIGEGSSDDPLARLVSDAFVIRGVDADIRSLGADRLGADGKSVSAKIQAAAKLFSGFEFVVIHRDCDNQEPEVRLQEITAAVAETLGHEFPTIALVPRTMTEAWLLLNEAAIRKTAGKPNSTVNLDLPKIKNLESVRDPKKTLQEVLLLASQETGRRRHKRATKFSAHRRNLLDQLNPETLAEVPSWQHTLESIDRYIARLN